MHSSAALKDTQAHADFAPNGAPVDADFFYNCNFYKWQNYRERNGTEIYPKEFQCDNDWVAVTVAAAFASRW